MSVRVEGIGWVTREGFGSVRRGVTTLFAEDEGVKGLVKREIFSQPFKNFGRLDDMSRLTVSAIALTLQDADIEYSAAHKQNIGIIGVSAEGSQSSDINYYRDFVDNGRTLSRANLFIYTLPSSAMGEAAIHFGLTGPLLYGTDQNNALSGFLKMATAMVADGEAERMLVGIIRGEDALYLLVGGRDECHTICSVEECITIFESSGDTKSILHELSLRR